MAGTLCTRSVAHSVRSSGGPGARHERRMVFLQDVRACEALRPATAVPAPEETAIEGVLESVTYTSEETGWSVVRLDVEGAAGRRRVGHLAGVRPASACASSGAGRPTGASASSSGWRAISDAPATLVGMERYLASV